MKEAKRVAQLQDAMKQKRKRVATAEGYKIKALAKMEDALADRTVLKKKVKTLKNQKKEVIATKKKTVGGLQEKVAGLQEASSKFGKEYSNKAGEGKGDPCAGEFLTLTRRLLSTMISAEQCKQQFFFSFFSSV